VTVVTRNLFDMKTLMTRHLSRKTASVHAAGRAIAHLKPTTPLPGRKPDWQGHFDWLKRQTKARSKRLLAEFEEGRRRLRAREKAMGNPQFHTRQIPAGTISYS